MEKKLEESMSSDDFESLSQTEPYELHEEVLINKGDGLNNGEQY